MQYSIQPFKKVISSSPNLRMDPDFFHPEYLAVENKLSDISLSSMFQKGVKVIHPNEIKRNFVNKNGVQFIRAQNVRPFFLNADSNPVFISKSDCERLSKNVITYGDILLTRTGANFGQCCLYMGQVESTASSHTFIIKSGTIEPAFLVVLLNTFYGRLILDKNMYGAAQQELAPYAIYNFPAPNFTKDFELKITSLFVRAHEYLNRSKDYLQQPEILLLIELGLEKWQPKRKLSFVANYAEVADANRFDADYFQPHYKELLEQIRSGDSMPLSEIADYEKGVEVGTDAYQSDGIPFIRVSDVSENGFEKTEKHISTELYRQLKADHAPKKGDVLFTKDGTIGRSFVVQEDKEAILSGAFLKLTVKKGVKVESDYLALILNSIICKTQIDRLSGGAIIAHLKPSDAMSMSIPVLDNDIQTAICSLIAQSRQERDESKRLLEIAKRAVEIAIEEDEAAAFHYIRMEIE